LQFHDIVETDVSSKEGSITSDKAAYREYLQRFSTGQIAGGTAQTQNTSKATIPVKIAPPIIKTPISPALSRT